MLVEVRRHPPQLGGAQLVPERKAQVLQHPAPPRMHPRQGPRAEAAERKRHPVRQRPHYPHQPGHAPSPHSLPHRLNRNRQLATPLAV